MSRILKAAVPAQPNARQGSPRPGQRVPSGVYEARVEAARLREAVAAEVAQVRSRLQADVALALARAEAEGREAGLGEAAELIARLAGERVAWLARAETEVLELGLAVAAKILGREVADRGAAADIVAEALRAVRRARAVKVRLHPDDVPIVRAAEPALLSLLTRGASLLLVEDESLTRGSAVVESEHGRVDARLEAQLAALRRALLAGEEGA